MFIAGFAPNRMLSSFLLHDKIKGGMGGGVRREIFDAKDRQTQANKHMTNKYKDEKEREEQRDKHGRDRVGSGST